MTPTGQPGEEASKMRRRGSKPGQQSALLWICLWCSCTALAADPQLALSNPSSGQTQRSELEISAPGETGFEIGAMTFVGAEIHLFHRVRDTPWMLGFSYLETDDDFINYDGDNEDRERRRLTGPFLRYLLQPGRRATFYAGGALYRVTEEIECFGVSDEDSARGLFFGAGYMGRRDGWLSYHVGLQFAPGLDLEADNGFCQSESEGQFHATASIMFIVH